MKVRIEWALVTLALLCAGSAPQAAAGSTDLAFTVQEGRTDNRFFRQGRVAAHLLATSGESPRIVVAFPAGNMGAGLWFDQTSELRIDGELSGIERRDHMRGVTASIRARAPRLGVKTAILGSVRALRDYGHAGQSPAEQNTTVMEGTAAVLTRTTRDGSHHLELSLEAIEGSVDVDAGGHVVLSAGTSGEIVSRVTVLSDEEPLTPLPPERILTAEAASDPRARAALSFLAYEQKVLAGSWQYLTYFGRDTLLSTRLLMPVLQPDAIEAALGSVIERLGANGEVAHEENVGEWATIEPGRDYKMVDDDFLLAPVLGDYFDSAEGAKRAEAFFARQTSSGRTFSELVRKNLDRVMAQAAPFAATPTYENLIRIHDGLSVGNWRDSEEGLGHGRFPYDVNAALVPAALRAAAYLFRVDGFTDAAAAEQAAGLARAWCKSEPLFRVTVDAEEARRRLTVYGAEQGIDVMDAVASIHEAVSFPALSLDARGEPIPIEHSDDGFVMMFTEPNAAWLVSAARRIVRPFPAGLRTPVGVVVANPAYATDSALRNMFTRDHYHGTVIWSWQQALLLSGLRRQIARSDLDSRTVGILTDAERSLARVIDATKELRTSELWSWDFDTQGFHVVPFGEGKGHHTEANAVQLWSTVYLALDREK